MLTFFAAVQLSAVSFALTLLGISQKQKGFGRALDVQVMLFDKHEVQYVLHCSACLLCGHGEQCTFSIDGLGT